jgi:ribosome-binding protein aMBF1 (putative translation factor)
MEVCFKCERSGEDVRLLDAISGGEIVKMCEKCALIEDMPIIKRPTTQQLKESERPYSVKERLRRMAGLSEEKEEVKRIAEKITDVSLDDLRLKIEKEELAKKKSRPLNLIDNFHWHVFMARRKKKLTRKELADLLGESETAVKMIENKELPEDSLILINKIEQFFGIKLKKEELKEEEEAEEERVRDAIKEKLDESKELKRREEPAIILKFNSESIKKVTIADLKRIKEELVEDIEKEEVEEGKWRKEENEDNLLGDDVEIVD